MRLELDSTPRAYAPIDKQMAYAAIDALGSFDQVLAQGISAAQAGNRSQARMLLQYAVEMNENSEAGWLWLASISEYPEELLAFLDRVLAINPKNARANEWKTATNHLMSKTFVQRGIEAVNEDRRKVALDCFNQALAYDDKNGLAQSWKDSLKSSDDSVISLGSSELPEYSAAKPELDASISETKATFESGFESLDSGSADVAAGSIVSETQGEPTFFESNLNRAEESFAAHTLSEHVVFDDNQNEKSVSAAERMLNTPFDEIAKPVVNEDENTGELEDPNHILENSSFAAIEPVATSTEDDGASFLDHFPVPEPQDEGAPKAGSPFMDMYASFSSEEESNVSPFAETSAAIDTTEASQFIWPSNDLVMPENENGFSAITTETFTGPEVEIVHDAEPQTASQTPYVFEEQEEEPVYTIEKDEEEPVYVSSFQSFYQTGPEEAEPIVPVQQFENYSSTDATTSWSETYAEPADQEPVHDISTGVYAEDADMLGEIASYDHNDHSTNRTWNTVSEPVIDQYPTMPSVSFPVEQIAPPIEPSIAEPHTPFHGFAVPATNEATHGTVSRTILVVDDSPVVRKLIAGKLEESGYNVVSAASGMEALAVISKQTPDLVLLDIAMPKMDGYDVCHSIRRNEATKNTPVVLISGKDGYYDDTKAQKAGTQSFISKPFGPETLMKALETYLS